MMLSCGWVPQRKTKKNGNINFVSSFYFQLSVDVNYKTSSNAVLWYNLFYNIYNVRKLLNSLSFSFSFTNPVRRTGKFVTYAKKLMVRGVGQIFN